MTDFHKPYELAPYEAPKSFTMKLECQNDVFQPYYTIELVRILSELIRSIEDGNIPERIRDINGNTVGSISIT